MIYEDKVKTCAVKADFVIDERLEALNILLPSPPKPAGSYVSIVITGNLAFVSGQIPIKDGKVIYAGKVSKDLSVEDAKRPLDFA